jgi:hypothetical protein
LLLQKCDIIFTFLVEQIYRNQMTEWLNIWSTKSPNKYHILHQQF